MDIWKPYYPHNMMYEVMCNTSINAYVTNLICSTDWVTHGESLILMNQPHLYPVTSCNIKHMDFFWTSCMFVPLIMSLSKGCPKKKEGLRILNTFDSYYSKKHLDGSKLGKNMWNAFNMSWQYLILMQEPPKIFRGPLDAHMAQWKT